MRAVRFSVMGAGVLLLAACGSHENPPLRASAVPPITTVAAPARPAPAAMLRAQDPLPAGDHEEPTDVSTLQLPQPEDTEPEPVK
jgi:hypothetical protein